VTTDPSTPGPQVQRAIPRDTLGALLAAQQEETGVPPQLLRADGTPWPVSVSAAAGKSLGEAPAVKVKEPPQTSSIDFAKACAAAASQELVEEMLAREIPSFEGVTFTALDDIPAPREPEPDAQPMEPVGPVEDCGVCPKPAACDTSFHRLDDAGATFISLADNELDATAAFRAAQQAVVDNLAASRAKAVEEPARIRAHRTWPTWRQRLARIFLRGDRSATPRPTEGDPA
jgi:hypothetical protein